MRKVLFGILIILLGVFIYMMLIRSIVFAGLKIDSIDDIKNANSNLNNKFDDAAALINQQYPNGLKSFNDSVKALNTAKSDYESKTQDITSNINLGTVQINSYPIEYLWTIIGNYAKKEGVTITLDLVNGTTVGSYNLNFKLAGNYISITDFVYDVENDSDLNFKIDNFSITPGGNNMDSSTVNSNSTNVNGDINAPSGRVESTSTQAANTINNATQATSTDNTINLNATFTVTDVSIKLDDSK